MIVSLDTTLPALPPRPEEGHKGTFGRVLIVAGSRGMSGAAALAGMGALRGGAGLVTVAVPAGVQLSVAGIEPSYLTAALPEDGDGQLSRDAAKPVLLLSETSTAVAIGPGWGHSPDLHELAHFCWATISRPLVVDADAINALARSSAPMPAAPEGAPRVMTPHPGEFARLLRLDAPTVERDREALATAFAGRHGIILVLKGHRTLITDGKRVAVNTTGNSGLATGGTGDVLTGLIAALLAQGMPPFDAAHLAAHLHGLAADIGAAEISQPGLIASDLPRYLARAWKQLGAN
jgi:NAD(P)H-hydrate epimerase